MRPLAEILSRWNRLSPTRSWLAVAKWALLRSLYWLGASQQSGARDTNSPADRMERRSDDLQFLHVSAPSPVLEIVTPAAARTRIASLFAAAQDEGMQTFRVKYWQHSAVAHLIPACHRSAEEDRLSYRPKLSS